MKAQALRAGHTTLRRNRVGHVHDVFHRPLDRRDAGRNGRRGLHGAVNLHEVVDHEIEADRVHVVLNLLGERIGQTSEAAHAHTHGRVRPLNV